MTDDNSEGGETASQRLIREAKEEAWHARRALHRDLPNPSGETKWQLATALADYRDLLVDYRDEDALDTEWNERAVDVDIIEKLLSQTTEVETTLNRRGHATQTKRVPLVMSDQVSGHFLIEIGKELDAIFAELGFGPTVEGSTHRTEISDELMEEVEKWRKQNLEA